jgi:hypothetical protein
MNLNQYLNSIKNGDIGYENMTDEEYLKMKLEEGGNDIIIGRKEFPWENMNTKKFHKTVSYVKSAIRIAGCAGAILFNRVDIGFALLLVAEVFGVIEEWKE